MSTSTELAPIQALKAELPTLQRLVLINAPAGVDAEALVLQELEYLAHHMIQKPELKTCTPLSVALAVKTVLKQNLSLDPYAGLVYVKSRKVKARGSKGEEIDVPAMEIQPSCNGLISIARQCGRILDMKRPQLTKDGSGKVTGVIVEFLLPSTPQPRWETFDFDESDFRRWAIASDRERKGTGDLKKANSLYVSWQGGIDPEFARAKAIRHALKKLGTNQHENMKTVFAAKPFASAEVDPLKDRAAANDDDGTEDTTHEVVSSTPHPEQPASNGSTVNADEL